MTVRVEVVELDNHGRRQIGARERATELLSDRRSDIQDAILEASQMISSSAEKLNDMRGWSVKTIEASFSLTLTGEAGILISKASAEAALEITISIDRDSNPSNSTQ